MIFPQVLATEFLKLRRSKVTWLSFVALSLAPLGIALMMWIVREPGRAAQLGLLGTKADLSGLTFLAGIIATILQLRHADNAQ